eukprot:CAMPEP_0182439828 /NCGR_PEP_ID=MMETSP1167-20130531/86679_1 /TAXON_ID=2988 /ORGANISM="Mallomonas Sp, Strain CCMP3275" /LENGTH=106 /DNA_ID=CAMNT_0024633621 /DNA_START=1008 /DNA_END=1328 /DNA_ORIENTATION=-
MAGLGGMASLLLAWLRFVPNPFYENLPKDSEEDGHEHDNIQSNRRVELLPEDSSHSTSTEDRDNRSINTSGRNSYGNGIDSAFQAQRHLHLSVNVMSSELGHTPKF